MIKQNSLYNEVSIIMVKSNITQNKDSIVRVKVNPDANIMVFKVIDKGKSNVAGRTRQDG